MLLSLTVLGCSQSGLNQLDQAGTGSTGDTAPQGLQDCPFVGTWSLSAVRCSTFEFDDWYDTHTGATLVIDHDPAGGCAVGVTIEGQNCTREESWAVSVPVGIEVLVTQNGVTRCDPAACKFDPNDQGEAECAEGDLTGTVEDSTWDNLSGSLTISGLFEDTAPGCSLTLVTTWDPG